MHLQVATLSDISDGNGQTVNVKIMLGQRPDDRQSPRAWPRQPSMTEYQVKLWDRYLRTHFVTDEGLHFRQSLGKWTSDSNLEWQYTQSPADQCTIRYDSASSGSTSPLCTLDSQGYTIWCVATCATYHHLLDSGYSHLLASPNSYITRHDGAGSTANSHPYLVCGPLAASASWPQAAVTEV
jgi:hypothetical protein